MQQRLHVAQHHREIARLRHARLQRAQHLLQELRLRHRDVSVQLARAAVPRRRLHVGGELLDALCAMQQRSIVLFIIFLFLLFLAYRVENVE